MIGTLINIVAIISGTSLGMFYGKRLPDRVRQTVVAGLGLFTAVIGIQMTTSMQQPLIVLGSILVGGIIGEWLGIEAGLQHIGAWLERRFANGNSAEPGASLAGDQQLQPMLATESTRQSSRFIHGFLTASLLYIIGPMAILGSIQDGLTGDFSLLAIKSVLDGFASLAFASTLGIGVMFSSLVVLVYQGSISLLAAQAQAFFTPEMQTELTATGGVILLGIAISSLLEIKPIRVGNFLPALLLAPLIVAILTALGIPIVVK